MLKIHKSKISIVNLLINKRENTCLKYFNDSKAFIEYSNDMDDIYENIEEYNSNKNLLETIQKLIMIIDNKIRDEKL